MHNTARFRRVALASVAAAVAAALLAGCASGGSSSGAGDSAIGGQVIWADYGGPTNESRQAAYFDSFYDKTGAEVVSTPIEDATYYSMLKGQEGAYDTFQINAHDLVRYPDHVLKIPTEAQGDLVPDFFRPYVLGGFYVGIAQGWLTKTFPNGGPQNWADFFNTKKFPGKRGWPGDPGSFDSSFEIALLADGVAPKDLYPLDLKRAVAKLNSIRKDIVFFQSYPEVQQLLSNGSVSIAVSVTGQFTALSRAGMDVTIQWNQAFSTLNGFLLPATAKNPEAVKALASWMNDPKRQAAFTERTLYGPVNSKVFDLLPADVRDQVVNSPSHDNLLKYDDVWRGKNLELLMDTYSKWLAG